MPLICVILLRVRINVLFVVDISISDRIRIIGLMPCYSHSDRIRGQWLDLDSDQEKMVRIGLADPVGSDAQH